MRKLWLKKNHSLVVFAWKELRYVFNVKKKDYFKLLKCWNCVIWIRRNKKRQDKFACEFANFYHILNPIQIERFYSTSVFADDVIFAHNCGRSIVTWMSAEAYNTGTRGQQLWMLAINEDNLRRSSPAVAKKQKKRLSLPLFLYPSSRKRLCRIWRD